METIFQILWGNTQHDQCALTMSKFERVMSTLHQINIFVVNKIIFSQVQFEGTNKL